MDVMHLYLADCVGVIVLISRIIIAFAYKELILVGKFFSENEAIC